MRRGAKRFARVLAAVAFLTGAEAQADSWRCGNRLVGVGDSALEVEAKCGAPNSRTAHVREVVIREATGVDARSVIVDASGRVTGRVVQPVPTRTRKKAIAIDEWSYVFETHELTRTLIFEDGRLSSILVGQRVTLDRTRCERQLFAVRQTSLSEVEATCGSPNSRDTWIETVEERLADDTVVTHEEVHERWTYNFGSSRFLRIFQFMNARLVDQTTTHRGF